MPEAVCMVAETKADTTTRWESRPWVARLLRALVFVLPFGASVVFVWVVSRVIAAPDGSVGFVAWWLGLSAAGSLVMWLVDRAARRLLPLAALLQLSLVFPDQAPSRFKAAMESGRVGQLRERLELAAPGGPREHARRVGAVAADARRRAERARQDHARPLRARARVRGDDRPGAAPVRGGDRPAQLGGAAARRRQAGDRERDPQQAGTAVGGGVAAAQAPSALRRGAGRADAPVARRVGRRRRLPPRALGRHGLPARDRRRADPAAGPDRGHRRRLRRDHLGALLQGSGVADGRPRGDRPLRRGAVRPAPGAGVPRRLARADADGDGPAVVAGARARARSHPTHARTRNGRELGRRRHRLRRRRPGGHRRPAGHARGVPNPCGRRGAARRPRRPGAPCRPRSRLRPTAASHAWSSPAARPPWQRRLRRPSRCPPRAPCRSPRMPRPIRAGPSCLPTPSAGPRPDRTGLRSALAAGRGPGRSYHPRSPRDPA